MEEKRYVSKRFLSKFRLHKSVVLAGSTFTNSQTIGSQHKKPLRETMEIRKLNATETENFANLIEIFKEVFEHEAAIPGSLYLSKLLSNPDFMVFVAKINDKVVGGLTIYILHQYFTEKPLAYIYDVGISPDFQGKGVGKALIAYVCNFCEENGFENAYVEAAYDDLDAIHFYRKTTFSYETQALHFTYSFADKVQY